MITSVGPLSIALLAGLLLQRFAYALTALLCEVTLRLKVNVVVYLHCVAA